MTEQTKKTNAAPTNAAERKNSVPTVKQNAPVRLDDFIVSYNTTCLDALQAIDNNHRGFVMVEDDNGHTIGTLTDGDIRRVLIKGTALTETIQASRAYNTEFISIQEHAQIDELIEVFKNPKLEFLPLLDGDMHLVGIVTRKQLYGLILQCKNLPSFDELLNTSESLIDFEIFQRPWGIYKTTVLQEKYQAKVLQVKPLAQLSLQYHNHREEHWIVASGKGIAQVGDSLIPVQQGSVVFIPRGCKHRMTNTSATEQLIISEVQIGDYFGEDDITRLEDKYGRAVN